MKRFSELFLRNLHYKVLSLIFAVLFWFLATNKEVTETTVRLEIKPIATGNYRVIDYTPKKLTFLVEGYRKELVRLKELKEVYFKLPPELAKENGWVRVKLNKNDFNLGPSVRVKRVEPSEIEVKVEKLVLVTVPVVAKLKNLPKGVRLELHPNYAVISLPEELKEIPISVETEEVDLKGVKLPAEFVVPLSSKFQTEPKKVKVVVKSGGENEGEKEALWDGRNKGNSE